MKRIKQVSHTQPVQCELKHNTLQISAVTRNSKRAILRENNGDQDSRQNIFERRYRVNQELNNNKHAKQIMSATQVFLIAFVIANNINAGMVGHWKSKQRSSVSPNERH